MLHTAYCKPFLKRPLQWWLTSFGTLQHHERVSWCMKQTRIGRLSQGLTHSIKRRGTFVAILQAHGDRMIDLSSNPPPAALNARILARALTGITRKIDADHFNFYEPLWRTSGTSKCSRALADDTWPGRRSVAWQGGRPHPDAAQPYNCRDEPGAKAGHRGFLSESGSMDHRRRGVCCRLTCFTPAVGIGVRYLIAGEQTLQVAWAWAADRLEELLTPQAWVRCRRRPAGEDK